jgi:hypothetical protein
MTMEDPCPTHGTCPGCGARLCVECGDDVREVGTGHLCGDCADLDGAA